MSKYGLILIAIIVIFTLTAYSFVKLPVREILRDTFSKETDIKTVNHVDINRYMGTWYSTYEFPAWFQKGCTCTKAEYSLAGDGTIRIRNSCKRGNEFTAADGTAIPIKAGDNSRLYVKFKGPFKGKYFILAIDDSYENVLVGTPDRNYLWILSRETTINEETLNKFQAKADELGFDISRLVRVFHDC